MIAKKLTGDYAMPGMRNGMKMRSGGGVKKMRGGGMAAKPKAAPMKKGGGAMKSRVRSSSKKAL